MEMKEYIGFNVVIQDSKTTQLLEILKQSKLDSASINSTSNFQKVMGELYNKYNLLFTDEEVMILILWLTSPGMVAVKKYVHSTLKTEVKDEFLLKRLNRVSISF